MTAKPRRKRACIRRWLRWLLGLAGLAVLLPLVIYLWVSLATRRQIHYHLPEVPTVRAALLLGTSPYTRTGETNQFFANRIEAAAALYASGRVQKLIVSGDNHHHSYNEPREMFRALVKAGVPDSAIVMDFAGFRTFDSVIRAHKVFGQQSMVVISQRFHAERAIFIANAKGIEAHGFIADDPTSLPTMIRLQFRESFARIMAVLDCYVLGTQPHFLGQEEDI